MQFDIKELLMLLGEKDLVIYQQQKTIDSLNTKIQELQQPKLALVKDNG